MQIACIEYMKKLRSYLNSLRFKSIKESVIIRATTLIELTRHKKETRNNKSEVRVPALRNPTRIIAIILISRFYRSREKPLW